MANCNTCRHRVFRESNIYYGCNHECTDHPEKLNDEEFMYYIQHYKLSQYDYDRLLSILAEHFLTSLDLNGIMYT